MRGSFGSVRTAWRRALTGAVVLAVMAHSGLCVCAEVTPKISVEFRDTDIRDVLQAVSTASRVSIAVDGAVEGKISVNLHNLPLDEALKIITQTGKCYYKIDGRVCRVSKEPFVDPPVVTTDGQGRVCVDARDADLRDLLLEVSRKTGISVSPAAGLAQKVSVNLSGVPAADAVQALSKVGGASCTMVNGVWYVESQAAPKPAQPAPVAPIAPDPGPPVEEIKPIVTKVFLPKHQRASQLVDCLSKACIAEATSMSGSAPEVKKSPDDTSIMITGTEQAIGRITRELEIIDIPSPQVMIEAKILDVNSSKEKEIGLTLAEWSENKTTVNLLTGQVAYVMSGVSRDLNAKFQALITDGYAKELASPSICTLSGKEASIDIGQVRYYKVTNTSDSTQSSNTTYYTYSTLQTINSGITLKITPWVGSTGEITASIDPEVSSVSGTTSEGYPEIDKRKASTTIRVRSGDTIVIGGLKQQSRVKTTTRVPILGSIPIIGQLFSNTSSTTTNSELVILITPRIMDTSAMSPDSAKADFGKQTELGADISGLAGTAEAKSAGK